MHALASCGVTTTSQKGNGCLRYWAHQAHRWRMAMACGVFIPCVRIGASGKRRKVRDRSSDR